jgi:colicin import membrane protein
MSDIELFVDQTGLPATIEDVQEGKANHIFSTEGGLTPFYEHVKSLVEQQELDASTDKGRKHIGSIARKVSSSKTLIEKHGRAHLKELKSQIKPIEGEIKKFVDAMNDLRDEVQRPVNEWQAEQDRIAAEKQAPFDLIDEIVNWVKEMPRSIDQIDNAITSVLDIDLSPTQERQQEAEEHKQNSVVTLNGYLAMVKQEKAKAEEEERQRIAEIEAKAKADAEAAVQRQIQQAELDKQEAELLAKQAQENANRQAELAAKQAEERAKREADKQAAQQAQEEKERQENVEHVRAVRNQTGSALIELGLTVDQAKAVMNAAQEGELFGLVMKF